VSFKRALFNNVAVQAFGPLSAFLTVIVIARVGGPGDQGQYAQLRAWADLVGTIGCFGFPQGFVYVINRLGWPASALATWSGKYVLAFVPVALTATAVALAVGGVTRTDGTSMLAATVALAGAAALLILHGLWRTIYLTFDAGIRFALFTILPSVALLLGCSSAMLLRRPRFEWVLFGAMILVGFICAAMMRPVLRGGAKGGLAERSWKPLLSNGMHAFVQTMLASLQPVVAYWFVRLYGGGSREIGYVNVGLFLVQGLSVPISMVAPLLLDRWTSAQDAHYVTRLQALATRLVPVSLAVGLLLAAGSRGLVPLLFGRSYGPAVMPAAIMLLSIPLAWYVRVIEPALHARSRPDLNTTSGVVRMAMFSLGAWILPRTMDEPLAAIAMAWTASNFIAGACTIVALRCVARSEPTTPKAAGSAAPR
jgi:O-antigen/teichoic acid export membrane protein